MDRRTSNRSDKEKRGQNCNEPIEHIKSATDNRSITLRNIPEDMLYGMIKALYALTDKECLIVWSYFFLRMRMADIDIEFNISANKQRTLYSKYKKYVNVYKQRFDKTLK